MSGHEHQWEPVYGDGVRLGFDPPSRYECACGATTTREAQRADARWQQVRCRRCGKGWVCTPEQDYFENTTLEDGLCWDCLMARSDLPPQPEPPYPAPPEPLDG
jgi:hypothetical protein